MGTTYKRLRRSHAGTSSYGRRSSTYKRLRRSHAGTSSYGRRSSFDVHTHRARSALDDLHRLVDVVRVQVGHLGLGDLPHLVAADRADLLAVGLARALREPDRLLDQDGGRGRLRDEGEGPVLVDRDLDRDDRARVGLRLCVEGLAEL